MLPISSLLLVSPIIDKGIWTTTPSTADGFMFEAREDGVVITYPSGDSILEPWHRILRAKLEQPKAKPATSKKAR